MNDSPDASPVLSSPFPASQRDRSRSRSEPRLNRAESQPRSQFDLDANWVHISWPREFRPTSCTITWPPSGQQTGVTVQTDGYYGHRIDSGPPAEAFVVEGFRHRESATVHQPQSPPTRGSEGEPVRRSPQSEGRRMDTVEGIRTEVVHVSEGTHTNCTWDGSNRRIIDVEDFATQSVEIPEVPEDFAGVEDFATGPEESHAESASFAGSNTIPMLSGPPSMANSIMSTPTFSIDGSHTIPELSTLPMLSGPPSQTDSNVTQGPSQNESTATQYPSSAGSNTIPQLSSSVSHLLIGPHRFDSGTTRLP